MGSGCMCPLALHQDKTTHSLALGFSGSTATHLQGTVTLEGTQQTNTHRLGETLAM